MAPEPVWQQLQKKTFTRYINGKLASKGLQINDLYEDVKDGKILYHFLEALTGASLKKYGRLNNGRMKIQRVANMNVVFAFLPDADVKISNIGVLDIVEGKPKSVLGLVWSIIAFYLVRDIGGGGERDVAAVKRRVLRWCRRRCGRRAPISDLTKSFKDGKAFLAILNDVDASGSPYEPSANPVENFERAFSDAEQKYGLPRMLDTSEDCWRDEISMLTYLASMMETLPERVEQPDTGTSTDAWLDARSDEIGERLATLCACASTPSDNAGRSAATAILKAAAQRAGLTETALGSSRVFSSDIDPTKPTLLYHASTHVEKPHTDAWRDVVDATPFSDIVKDGRVTAAGGRAKGSCLAPFLACEACSERSLNILVVIGSGDDEKSAVDVRALKVEADYALVSDSSLTCAPPGMATLVFGCRGDARLCVKKDNGDELASSIACVDTSSLPSLKGVAQRSSHGVDACSSSFVVEQLATSADGATASIRVLTPPSYDGDVNLSSLGTVTGSLRPGYLTEPDQSFADAVERAQCKAYGVEEHARVLSASYAPISCALHETLSDCAVFQAGRAPAYVDRSGRPGESVAVKDVIGEAKVLARLMRCASSDLAPPAPPPKPFAKVVEEPKTPTSPHFDGRQIGSPRQRRKLPAGRVWPPPSPSSTRPSAPPRSPSSAAKPKPADDAPVEPTYQTYKGPPSPNLNAVAARLEKSDSERGDTPPPPSRGHGPASPPASPGPTAPPSPSPPKAPRPALSAPAAPLSAPAAEAPAPAPAPAPPVAHRGAFAGWFAPRPAASPPRPRADSPASLDDVPSAEPTPKAAAPAFFAPAPAVEPAAEPPSEPTPEPAPAPTAPPAPSPGLDAPMRATAERLVATEAVEAPAPVDDTPAPEPSADAMAAFLAAAAPAVPPPRASRTTKVLFTPAVPDKEDAAPEESHPPAQEPPAPPARKPLAEIVGRDSHDSAPGDPGLSKAVVSRESTPRAASPVPEAQDAGSDAESWETGSTHHDDARSTASDESWATEASEAAAAQPRKKQAKRRHVCPTTLPPPRPSPVKKSPAKATSPGTCRATRPIVAPSKPAPLPPASASKPRAPTCPTAKHPPRASPAKPRAFSPAKPRLPPSSPPAPPSPPPRSPPASPTESFFQGDPSRDSPGRDAPIPELATPAEVIDEINRVRRDPAAYAAFLRSHVAPRYRLDDRRADESLLGHRPESTPAPRGRRRRERVAGEEAIAELDALGADCLPPLKAHVGMTRAAEDHVEDLVRTKRLGHTGSDGSAPAQRLNRHGRWFERASECLSHGRRTAMAAVAQMIIDDGVASRAQRRGLLSDRARAVGCALRMHPRHGAVCCVTLAGGYGPPPLEEARKVVADAVNLPDDFEEVLFSVPVVDIHDRVYQALERGGKVVLDYAPGALKLSVWDAAGKGEKFAVDWDPALWEV